MHICVERKHIFNNLFPLYREYVLNWMAFETFIGND